MLTNVYRFWELKSHHSVTQLCLHDYSTPGFPWSLRKLMYYPLEFAQTHVLSLGVCANSCPLSRWFHLTISFSVAPFSSCPQSFPESESFPMSWLFVSDGQRTGASASPSVLPINIQGWFPLGLTAWISLQTKGLSRVFSNTTVWKHQL